MDITNINARVNAIESLAINELTKRQPMLVALLADLVNAETEDGMLTELNTCLEGQDWWHTLHELTKDAGFKRLGNGHFSAAYSHPLLPGKVIKVGFKKEDSGAAYTAFCRMHQGRAGIPNIYDVQRHAGCYTVVLDALVESDTWDNDEHERYADIARDVIEYNSNEHNDLYGWDEEFVETCKMIRKFFDGIASFDMHSGNIMFDEDDTPYITDPVSFTQRTDKVFSIEPEELLQEIEQVAHEKFIERCKDRKERHENRVEFRKARRNRRKMRKARKVNANNNKKHIFEWRQAVRMGVRNEERAKDFLGLNHWRNVWCNMPVQDFAKLELMVAAQVANIDHKAIVNNQPLHIDRYLDKRFMG